MFALDHQNGGGHDGSPALSARLRYLIALVPPVVAVLALLGPAQGIASNHASTGATISKFSPSSGVAGTSVTITGSALQGATAVAFGGTSAASFSATTKGVKAVVGSGSSSGPIAVTTPDGTATSSRSFTVLPTPSPAISSFTPVRGPAGTHLTITGTGFVLVTAVKVGGTEVLSFSVSSPRQISAVVAQGTTSGPVSVTAAGGVASSTTDFAVPNVINLGGCVQGTGTADVAASADIFLHASWTFAAQADLKRFLSDQTTYLSINGGPNLKSKSFWDRTGHANPNGSWDTDFAFDTGLPLASKASITVDFQSVVTKAFTDGYTNYVPGDDLWARSQCTIDSPPPATIDSFAPASGPVGSPVVITGTNLDLVTGVKFGNLASPLTNLVNGQLKAKVPAGATDGPITLVQGDYHAATSQATFSVTPSAPLSITAVTPDLGDADLPVDIHGTGLYAVTSVKVGGVDQYLEPYFWSDNQIEFIPALGSHSGLVTVSDGVHTASSSTPFTYVTNGGQLDTTFNLTGWEEVDPNPALNDQGVSVAVQPDGKIIGAGVTQTHAAGMYDAILLRLNVDGTRDLTFGNEGIVDEPTQSFQVANIVVQPDGKILVGGDMCCFYEVLRFLPNGQPDPSFGTAGVATVPFPGCFDPTSERIALMPDGRVLVAGQACGIGLAMLNDDGSLDTSWGTGGRAETGTLFEGVGPFTGLLLQSDGKIVVVGGAGNSVTPQMFIGRLNADGTLDQTFGSGGQVYLAFPDSRWVTGASLDSSGRLVFSGGTMIGRLTTSGQPDPTFGDQGYVTAPGCTHPGDVIVDGDGEILSLGETLYRLFSDGTIDPLYGIGFDPHCSGGTAPASGALTPDGKLVTIGTDSGGNGEFVFTRTTVEPTVIP